MYRDQPYTFCLHICIASSIISISHQNSMFVTKDEPPLIYYNHPKSTFCLRVHFSVVHAMSLDKYVMTYIHHYIIQSILCALPIHPFSTCHSWQPLIILLLPEFCVCYLYFKNKKKTKLLSASFKYLCDDQHRIKCYVIATLKKNTPILSQHKFE